jgi:cellobiose transport system substrate-binding protein
MFMARRNQRVLVGVVAVAALAVAGCSSKSKTTAAPASSASPSTAATSPAPVAASTAAASASAPAPASSAAAGPAETITIGLFGTFGYKEAGLYDAYMKLHPNITIKEDDVEQSSDYYKALQTHLAAGSGLDDIQGIEIGFVADVTANHASQFVDFNSLSNGADLKSTFYPWKWAMATSSDNKTIGLGTDAGPEAMCYRPDLLKAAGLPSDRAALSQTWSTWQGFIDFGKQYAAKTHKPFLDSAASVFNAAVTQGTEGYDNSAGKPDVKNSDGVTTAWALATSAATAKITAGLSQFSTPWNQAFANGAFAAISCPSWMLGYITSEAGQAVSGDWDVANLPGGAANWGGSWLGVPTASKHQADAEALAEWLTAPAQQITMWTAAQHFPSSSTGAKDPTVATATSDYFNKAPIGQIFGDSASKLKQQPIGPYDTQIQSDIDTSLGNVETKGEAPAKAFSEALANIAQVVGS